MTVLTWVSESYMSTFSRRLSSLCESAILIRGGGHLCLSASLNSLVGQVQESAVRTSNVLVRKLYALISC